MTVAPLHEGVTLHRVRALDFALTAWDWPFAQAERARIDAFWEARLCASPKLWNGRVLLLKSFTVADETCRGEFFETDYAAFAAWSAFGFPPAGAWNGFSMGALRSGDGAFLLGRMGAHTFNAGQVYFPAGTPDRSDVCGATVDLWGSVMREVAEETGLQPHDYAPQPHWTVVVAGASVACIRVLDVPLPALALQARIRATLARDSEPELADVVIVRGSGELQPSMRSFVRSFLEAQWA